MSAAKKFRDHYPEDANAAKDPSRDKEMIKQYVNKIADLLENDPVAQKKAAAILEALINKSK